MLHAEWESAFTQTPSHHSQLYKSTFMHFYLFYSMSKIWKVASGIKLLECGYALKTLYLFDKYIFKYRKIFLKNITVNSHIAWMCYDGKRLKYESYIKGSLINGITIKGFSAFGVFTDLEL